MIDFSPANATFLALSLIAGLAILGVALHEAVPEWLAGGLVVGVAAIVGSVYVYSLR